MPTYRPTIAMLFLASGFAAVQPANAGVNLIWRTDASSYCVGDTIRVRLYAASDNPEENEFFIAGDIGFAWDQIVSPNYPTPPIAPTHLQFLGIDNTGSIFNPPPPNPSGISELLFPDTACTANEAFPPRDGDGFYRCTAPLGRVMTATPNGSLMTTLLFRAIAPAAVAKIEVLYRSRFCFTKVYDSQTPNLNILNPLTGYGSILLAISSCGGCDCPGDVDSSGARNGLDAQEFIKCALGSGSSCSCADMDNSGAVNAADVSLFVTSLTNGPACP